MVAASTTKGKSEWISILKNLMGICTERELTLTCDILRLHTCKLALAQTPTFIWNSLHFKVENRRKIYEDEWMQWMLQRKSTFANTIKAMRKELRPAHIINTSQVVNKYWKIRNSILWFMFFLWSVNIEDEILIWMKIIFLHNTHQCYHNIDVLLKEIFEYRSIFQHSYKTS